MLRFGEVVLIRMPFHQATGVKVRPAVVLLDTGGDDFVAAQRIPVVVEEAVLASGFIEEDVSVQYRCGRFQAKPFRGK